MFYCKISEVKSPGRSLWNSDKLFEAYIEYVCVGVCVCVCVCVCACVYAIQIWCWCTFLVESIQGNVTHSFCAERGA